MVGKAVLLECIESDKIENILLINRTSLSISSPKIKELILKDFNQIGDIENELKGYDACFHCMGVSSVGLSETDFNQVTFELTKKLMDSLYKVNPKMVITYVSGAGTDSSEKGRVMWARIKGKTENYILTKGFQDAYAIRLGVILPEKGIQSKTGWYNTMYKITRPLFPLMKKSKSIITTTSFGKALINVIFYPQENKKLDNIDLNKLAILD